MFTPVPRWVPRDHDELARAQGPRTRGQRSVGEDGSAVTTRPVGPPMVERRASAANGFLFAGDAVVVPVEVGAVPGVAGMQGCSTGRLGVLAAFVMHGGFCGGAVVVGDVGTTASDRAAGAEVVTKAGAVVGAGSDADSLPPVVGSKRSSSRRSVRVAGFGSSQRAPVGSRPRLRLCYHANAHVRRQSSLSSEWPVWPLVHDRLPRSPGRRCASPPLTCWFDA